MLTKKGVMYFYCICILRFSEWKVDKNASKSICSQVKMFCFISLATESHIVKAQVLSGAFCYLPVPGPPEPPNNVQASSTCDSIEVTWEASLKDGGSPVTGYTVKLLNGGESVASQSLTNLSRSTSFTNLKKKTEYEVRLNSNNALGGGEWRSISLNTTVACKEIRGISKAYSN